MSARGGMALCSALRGKGRTGGGVAGVMPGGILGLLHHVSSSHRGTGQPQWDLGRILHTGMSLMVWQQVTVWGCDSSLGEGVGGVSPVLCIPPEVAAGRSATLAMQEKEISRSRMTPRSRAATSLPSLSPSTGCPVPVPPCRGPASGQGAGTGWAVVPAPGSREPRNLSAYKSLIS